MSLRAQSTRTHLMGLRGSFTLTNKRGYVTPDNIYTFISHFTLTELLLNVPCEWHVVIYDILLLSLNIQFVYLVQFKTVSY